MSTSSGTKVKATWTPELHEIFLDICLEQKLEGNKPGTYFTKEGWTNILELFYCKTGLSYEKKQLKNHWDISREQWKAWCKLVGTSSMKWDPETSTFGASDEDWTKYTQANPEAAQFRFKALQNIDKTSSIFDDITYSGAMEVSTRKRRNGSSATSVLHDEEPSTPKADGQNENPDAAVVHSKPERQRKRSLRTRPKAIWTPDVHEIFLDICVDETLKGNKPGTHLTKEGWRNLIEVFQEKTGLNYERIQLKNHWDITKEQWKIWCKLINTSYMNWDPITNKFGASHEDWATYLQANPEAAQYRYKALQSTNKLELIFDGDMITGDIDHPIQRRRLDDDDLTASQFTLNDQDATNTFNKNSNSRLDDSPSESYLHVDEPVTTKLDSKTRHLYDAESGSAVTIRKGYIAFQPTQGKLDYSIGECIDCLDRMEDVEQGSSLYLFALDLFLKKEYREIFLQLKNPNVRIAWLQRLQTFSPPLQ